MVLEQDIPHLQQCQKYVKIVNHLDNHKITCAIFLDFAKAFNTVDDSVLLQKLYMYSVRGIAFDFLKCYLCNRKHYTVVNGIPSSTENVTCGVPQGSTLGPLLFLLYMNDLLSATKFKVNLFADGTNLTMSGNNAKQFESDINNLTDQWSSG